MIQNIHILSYLTEYINYIKRVHQLEVVRDWSATAEWQKKGRKDKSVHHIKART